jgi:hypothetical protein
MCQQLVAVTAEGCSIRRDDLLGYVVECGLPQTRPLQAATLAYALCQQLVPRRWRDNKP